MTRALNKLLLDEATTKAAVAKNKFPILFIGRTGAGKSTTINLLSECNMMVEEIVIKGKKTGSKKLKTSGLSLAKEGHNGTAETLFAQIIDRPNLTFCDLPGFGENRGENERIIVKHAITGVIQNSEGIRGLMIVIDYPTLLETKAEKFAALIKDIIDYLKAPSDLTDNEKQAFSFAITQIPTNLSKENVEGAIEGLKEKLEDIKSKESNEYIIANLITPERMFIIREDGQGFRQDSNELIDIAENRQHILDHLTRLPPNSFDKNFFNLIRKKDPDIIKASAVNEIGNLSQSASQSETQDPISQKLLLPIQTGIQTLSEDLLKILDGTGTPSKTTIAFLQEQFKQLRNFTINAVSIDTLRQLSETRSRLFKLHQAIKIRFPDLEYASVCETGLKEITYLQTALRRRMTSDSSAKIHANYMTLSDTALSHIQKQYEAKKLEIEALKKDISEITKEQEAKEKETKTLQTVLDQARNALQILTNQGRPAISTTDPGNEPTIPDNPGSVQPSGKIQALEARRNEQMDNDQGYRRNNAYCSVVEIYNERWVNLPAHEKTPARQSELLNAACQRADPKARFLFARPFLLPGENILESNAYFEEDARRDWLKKKEAYNAALSAHQRWDEKKRAFDKETAVVNLYDANLKTAQTAVTAAQQALNDHQTIVNMTNQQHDTRIKEITQQESTLLSLEHLRLMLIGTHKVLTQLLHIPHRDVALSIYRLMIDKLGEYQNILPNTLIVELRTTLEALTIEERDITNLYQINDQYLNDKQRLEILYEDQVATPLSAPNNEVQSLVTKGVNFNQETIANFSQKLQQYTALTSVQLQAIGLTKEMLAILLPALEQLTELTVIDLSNNDHASKWTDHETLLALLNLIQHSNVLDIIFDSSPEYHEEWELLLLTLLYKQQLQDKDAANIQMELAYDRLQQFIFARKLLSITKTEMEKIKFTVTVPNDNVKQFDITITEDVFFDENKQEYLKTANVILGKQTKATVKKSNIVTASTTTLFSNSKNNSPKSTLAEKAHHQEGNEWYTEDQIITLLERSLGNDARATVIAQTQIEHEGLLTDNLQAALRAIQENDRPVVIPFHIHNNHWTGMVIRRNSNRHLQIIYQDPLGGALEDEVQVKHIVALITAADPEAKILDLKYEQQSNGYDCGPFTADNLIRLATRPIEGLDRDEICALLYTSENGSAADLREEQRWNLLQRPAANENNITQTHGTLYSAANNSPANTVVHQEEDYVVING